MEALERWIGSVVERVNLLGDGVGWGVAMRVEGLVCGDGGLVDWCVFGMRVVEWTGIY